MTEHEIDRALNAMREADPARDLPSADDATIAATAHAAQHGIATFPIGSVEPGRTAWLRPRLQIVLAVAAVVAVAWVSTAIARSGSNGHPSAAGPTDTASTATTPTDTASTATTPTDTATYAIPQQEPSFGPTGTLGTWDDPHFAATLAAVEQALAASPTLPGATEQQTAPVATLDDASGVPGSNTLIDRARFWTAPGSIDAAIAYFTAHPPVGSTLDGTGTSGGPGGATVNELMFATQSGPATNGLADNGVGYLVQVVGNGDGVAVRVDVQAIWVPSKPAVELIGQVSSVAVVVNRNGQAPTVSRTLTGAPAQQLADAIDALQVDGLGTRSCPASFGFVDTLTFDADSGRAVVASVIADGCAGVGMTVDGAKQPQLAGGVDGQVLSEMGLPSNYGR
jgi:hypothetical protein